MSVPISRTALPGRSRSLPRLGSSPVSALTGRRGRNASRARVPPGKTAAFLGSSGAGESALIDALLGTERQTVNTLRKGDMQGRIPTTRRELIALPQGGLVIDTPGMRELQMWGDEESVSHAFADIEELSGQCGFRDCTHQQEPDCAVHQAVEEGSISRRRPVGKLPRAPAGNGTRGHAPDTKGQPGRESKVEAYPPVVTRTEQAETARRTLAL